MKQVLIVKVPANNIRVYSSSVNVVGVFLGGLGLNFHRRRVNAKATFTSSSLKENLDDIQTIFDRLFAATSCPRPGYEHPQVALVDRLRISLRARFSEEAKTALIGDHGVSGYPAILAVLQVFGDRVGQGVPGRISGRFGYRHLHRQTLRLCGVCVFKLTGTAALAIGDQGGVGADRLPDLFAGGRVAEPKTEAFAPLKLVDAFGGFGVALAGADVERDLGRFTGILPIKVSTPACWSIPGIKSELVSKFSNGHFAFYRTFLFVITCRYLKRYRRSLHRATLRPSTAIRSWQNSRSLHYATLRSG